jgi:hypothetical protein
MDATKVAVTGDYPVLVTHDNIPEAFWTYVNTDGSDIVVTDDSGTTKLDRDLVKLSITDSCMVLRFFAELSSSVDTVFYLYYGNPDATETNSTDAYPATLEMYISGDEVETGAPATLYDRTENNNDMTAVSIVQDSTPANVGYVITFDSTGSDYAYAADSASLDITNNLTVMLWIRGADSTPDLGERILSKYKTSDGNRSWMISSGSNAGEGDQVQVYISDDGSFGVGHRKQYLSSVSPIVDGAWHHFAFTFASGALKLYMDGVEDTTPTKTVDDAITTIYAGAAPVVLGANGDLGERWGSGYLDEIKVFSEALSANQILTYFRNEGATEDFYTVSGVFTANIVLNITKILGVPLVIQ